MKKHPIISVVAACLTLLVVGLLSMPSAMSADDDASASQNKTEEIASLPEKKDLEKQVEFDGADTAWMMVASAFVLMMVAPGLALFYGGLVRKKNILGVMMQCIFLMGIMSVVWAMWGYSLAFSEDMPYTKGFVGGFNKVALRGVMPRVEKYKRLDDKKDVFEEERIFIPATEKIPESLFMVFQMMFFIITPALICGAFAERMKFSSMVLFSVLWGTFVYCPIAHWVWSGKGWLCEFNEDAIFPAIDFAGGTVVHISSGVAALVCALVIGKRKGFGREAMPPHNLTYTLIGATLLWVGWFGFNAGSALAASTSAVNAFVATHLAAAAGVLAWAGAEWVFRGKPSLLGAASGAVAGLVCITPACGSVTPISGIILGFIAGLGCYFACTTLKNRYKYDDSLDAFGVHGVGGTIGAVLAGVFASKAILGIENNHYGLIEGNSMQIVNQCMSVGAAALISLILTYLILKIIDSTLGLRVTEDEEQKGLDITQHGEEGYIFQ